MRAPAHFPSGAANSSCAYSRCLSFSAVSSTGAMRLSASSECSLTNASSGRAEHHDQPVCIGAEGIEVARQERDRTRTRSLSERVPEARGAQERLRRDARLLDGDRAEASVVELVHKLCRDTLMTVSVAGIAGAATDIFVVDGNFAATAGIAEMLLQSHRGKIELLPALPKAWPAGSVKGLRARDGFVVDEEWRDGKLASATIHALVGGPCMLRLGEKTVTFATKAGERHAFNGRLERSSQ